MQPLQLHDGPEDRQRDYLLLTAYVFAQHGYLERALILVNALLVQGEQGERVHMAHLVLTFLSKDYDGALAALDRLEALYPTGRRQSEDNVALTTRNYLRARCLCEIGRRSEGERIARSQVQKSGGFHT